MEALICPQCGGQITDYSPNQSFVTCGYCSTKVLINSAKPAPVPPVVEESPEYTPISWPSFRPQPILIAFGTVFLIFGVVLFIAMVSGGESNKVEVHVSNVPYPQPKAATPLNVVTPVAPDLLSFGGEGTGNGLFTDASSIAVDKDGMIYVGDSTLRLQQFDTEGKFLRVWQLPSKGANYDHARSINKVGVDDTGRMFVAIGGVILVYNKGADKPSKTIQVAPDFIQSFALRSDGGILFLANDNNDETLYFADRNGRVGKRIKDFHTEPADAVLSPWATGLDSIRFAVDGPGNIYSVFAFGSLGSYSISYNADELLIERFSRDGKYINKFVQSMSSVDIAADNQSRIYVTDGGAVNIYTKTGDFLSAVTDANKIDAFTLDRSNNIYLVAKEHIRKLPPV